MVKKLVRQIYNERGNNIGLLLELLIVSVVLWFVVDNLYCRYVVYTQPMGMNIEHCYYISLSELHPEAADYVAYTDRNEERDAAIWELLDRVGRRPEVEAAAMSSWNSVPYSLGYSSTTISYDTLSQGVRRLEASPDFFRVFRIQGGRGETPEQLSEQTDRMENGQFLLSANAFDKYGLDVISLIGKDNFHLYGNPDRNDRLGGTFQPIRQHEYKELNSKASKSIFFKMRQSASHLDDMDCIVVRVRADQDHDFIKNLTADAAKNLQVGNIYISDVQSIQNMKRVELQEKDQETMLFVFGMGFLLLNIFLGLLGTFWFRTQQRKCEIALHLVHGATRRDVFSRLLCEGFYLVALITPIAMIIDFNLAYAELNAVFNGTTFEIVRFLICVGLSTLSILLMMAIGICIPAKKAMKVQPAEALHGE